jgi:3-hydroxyisobutyrate dehydrogenase-like beta-hydroxyacid dehydrogenase
MSETIGVVGAGRMGLPIIGHLARAGFRTLATDLDVTKQARIEGKAALWRPDAASLARECDIVLVCVGFDREVRELFARGGPLRSARRGTVCAS